MEKLSEENKKLKFQLVTNHEDNQLNYVNEYENKSFKSQLDLLKIHFKAFINMFTSSLDHIINRCLTASPNNDTQYGINELKSIVINKIN